MRSFRTSQEKPPWKELADITDVVENRFIFDVHLSSTIVPFRELTPRRAILPVHNNTLLDEATITSHAPGLGRWWDATSKIWEGHKTKQSRLTLWANLNYQGKLTKQLGGTKHRVVYTKSGTKLAAARLDTPEQVIDHSLYWIPARDINEARYLVGVLNSPALTKAVEAYQSRGLFGARHFDTYVWRLPIPVFNPDESLHQRIVDLSTEAEETANATDLGSYGFQKARGLVRAALDAAGINDALDTAVDELLNKNTGLL